MLREPADAVRAATGLTYWEKTTSQGINKTTLEAEGYGIAWLFPSSVLLRKSL